MVTRRFSQVKFKKLPCELLFPQDETCHLPETTCGICSRRVITLDVAMEIPISCIIQVPRESVIARLSTTHDKSNVRTVQANYNLTHALYHAHEARVFQRGEREIIMLVPLNSHSFAKPRVIATRAGFTCVPHILSLVGM